MRENLRQQDSPHYSEGIYSYTLGLPSTQIRSTTVAILSTTWVSWMKLQKDLFHCFKATSYILILNQQMIMLKKLVFTFKATPSFKKLAH